MTKLKPIEDEIDALLKNIGIEVVPYNQVSRATKMILTDHEARRLKAQIQALLTTKEKEAMLRQRSYDEKLIKEARAESDKRIVEIVTEEIRSIVEGHESGVVYSYPAIGKRATKRLQQLKEKG